MSLIRKLACTLTLGATLTSVVALDATPAHAKRSIKMIALGDSYSAGVGVGIVAPGCDRDGMAYAPRARKDLLPKHYTVSSFTHVACSGAVTKDITKSGGQASKVSGQTVATMTIGGNDIGFAGYAAKCVIGSCPSSMYKLNPASISWDTLHDRLVNSYVAVRKRMASSGHLYVHTYPIPFALQGAAKSCAGLTWTEQKLANALVTRLDDTIYHAVNTANARLKKEGRSGNVHFVEWRTGTRTKAVVSVGSKKYDAYTNNSWGLCNTKKLTPYVNGLSGKVVCAVSPASCPFALGNSFHPNTTGYWAGAERLRDAMRKHQP